MDITCLMSQQLVCRSCKHLLKVHYLRVVCRCPCFPCQAEGCECNRVWG